MTELSLNSGNLKITKALIGLNLKILSLYMSCCRYGSIWSLIQDVANSKPFSVMTNIFVTEFSEFCETFKKNSIKWEFLKNWIFWYYENRLKVHVFKREPLYGLQPTLRRGLTLFCCLRNRGEGGDAQPTANWMQHFNLSTSAKPVITKVQILSINNIVNMEIFRWHDNLVHSLLINKCNICWKIFSRFHMLDVCILSINVQSTLSLQSDMYHPRANVGAVRNSSCGKVMFSQASVIRSTGGGCVWWGPYVVGGDMRGTGVHGQGEVYGCRMCMAWGVHSRGMFVWGACLAGCLHCGGHVWHVIEHPSETSPEQTFWETRNIFVFQMEFDKTRGSCSCNSAEIRLSYHLYLHRYNAVFEGQSSQARQNWTQNSARGIKTWCLKLDLMQLLLVRSLQDLQENYFKSFFLCLK